MEGEFNNLAFNNSKITFNPNPDNKALSDELNAPIMYQESMGTNYSRQKAMKRASKIAVGTGIVILSVAASIQAGSFINNGFVLNPPQVKDDTYEVKDNIFYYQFAINNKENYKVSYYFSVNNKNTDKIDCSVETTYQGEFKEFKEDDKCLFYVEFTNRYDYTKTIKRVKFNIGGITK